MCTFRQRDLYAGLKATLMAGIEVERIEIGQDGKIVIIAGNKLVPDTNGGSRIETPEELRMLL
jgi:hypothetical protein